MEKQIEVLVVELLKKDQYYPGVTDDIEYLVGRIQEMGLA